MKRTLVAAALALAVCPVFSQTTAGPAGHWEGTIATPDRDLQIVVDLAQGEKGAWKGTIGIPQQGLKGFPLSDIDTANGAVKFSMKGVPGDPVFDGKLAAGGKSVSGTFTQGGASMPFSMNRTGEGQFETIAKSTPVAKEIEGSWEGALETGRGTLHLVLKLANEGDAATGTMTSVDQGGAVIPIAVITQKDSSLKLELPTVGGSFAGEVSKDFTAITGTWTQGMGTLPLTLHRPAAAK